MSRGLARMVLKNVAAQEAKNKRVTTLG